MASQLRDMSSFAESAKLFQESFGLDPTLPEARVGVAQQKMGEGNLDEAEKLLDFLMEPGAGGDTRWPRWIHSRDTSSRRAGTPRR